MKNNKDPNKKKYASISKYAILTFIACFIFYKIFDNLGDTVNTIGKILNVLSPFILAIIFAYFLNPIVNFFDKHLFSMKFKEKHRILHRVLAITITYIIVLAAIAVIFIFLIPTLVDTVTKLVNSSGDLMQNIKDSVTNIFKDNPDSQLAKTVQEFLDTKFPELWGKGGKWLTDFLPVIIEYGKSFLSGVINVVLAVIISVYILWGKTRLRLTLRKFFSAILPDKAVAPFLDVCSNSNRIFSRYLTGKTIDSIIIGIITLVAMNIIGFFGIEGFNELSVLISVLVGVTNMIPYFGPVIGAIPGLIILLAVNPFSALVFLILIFAIQQFDGNILGPKILGDSTGLQPIWVIFGVIVGGWIAGVAGMFLGVPVVAVLGYLLNRLAESAAAKKAELRAREASEKKEDVSEKENIIEETKENL